MSKETISVQGLGKLFLEKRFSGEWVCSQLRFLLGRVLTIVDSSIIDAKQNKAMKDLVKGEFVDKLGHVSDILSDGRDIVAPEGFDPSQTVSEDEALGLGK